MPDLLTITYIGGPTVLLEYGGVRLLTDPTFDPGGGEYPSGPATLRKLAGPGLSPEELGAFDYVLLSHDHHFDNLDHSGRALLAKAKSVLTTADGAGRLGGNSRGLRDWESVELATRGGRAVRVAATPGRHGPEGLHRGPVIGFALCFENDPAHTIYISGDTVWYPALKEVARRFGVRAAILHVGAARVPEVGNFPLTMTSEEAVEAAGLFADSAIVPIHFEDWAHFSEGRDAIAGAFAEAHLQHRLRWPRRGRPIHIDLQAPLAA